MKSRQLQEAEEFWVRCEPWLNERGYRLRARYRPGWIASWKDRMMEPSSCEDGQMLENAGFLDAERISDGMVVCFKKLPASDSEVEMNRILSEMDDVQDPRNHCARCFEILSVPRELEPESDIVLLVLPFLTRWHEPEFDTVGEALDFFKQLCEGLQFLHDHYIAHNDIKFNNIMMDSRPLYDLPIHPANPLMARDWSRKVRVFTRTERPVKYYYIDFGLSEQQPQNRKRCYGGDRTVPEFKRNEPADPFTVDIYRLGNLFRECLMSGTLSPTLFPKRRGLEFMDGLITDMTLPDPDKRPTIHEVVSRFGTLQKGLKWKQLRAPLIAYDDTPLGAQRWGRHWRTQISYTIKGKPAIPTAAGG
ncbi:hypothetical protein E1B28_005515 [Marasmius oreades]|uniref:Protein kinase domain-containing protein n=1 Tax=Marasmius oreades TaxID=181124 RepID=A0A9P7UVR2_9AGAR|nr:uncharacterized protein E1B28_005515 [Marasmius oreades]KAG7094696.1 hypothetical protein E1B28_005515 [Marasmius oreades]